MWKKIGDLPEDLKEDISLVIITRHDWIHGARYCNINYDTDEKVFDLEDCGGEWIPKENVKYWCYKEEFLKSIQESFLK